MKRVVYCFLIAAFMMSGCYLIPGTPEAAFHEFQATQHKESFIVAPLCAAGESVVPIVIERVKYREFERRLYAIGFLGTTESPAAADALEVIGRDDSENEYLRYTAIQSLFMIDESRGRQIANQFKDRTDYVGEISREIVAVDDHSSYKQLNSLCNITE